MVGYLLSSVVAVPVAASVGRVFGRALSYVLAVAVVVFVVAAVQRSWLCYIALPNCHVIMAMRHVTLLFLFEERRKGSFGVCQQEHTDHTIVSVEVPRYLLVPDRGNVRLFSFEIFVATEVFCPCRL